MVLCRSVLNRVFVLALASQLSASCHTSTPEELVSGARPPSVEGETPRVPGLDLSRMTEYEQTAWARLVSEQLSPCGDPVAVGPCAEGSKGCAACVPAAHYLARLVMEGYEPKEIEEQYRGRFLSKDSLSPAINQDTPIRGAPMAAVTIVEYSDFECPYCGRARPLLDRALATFEGRVKLAFKYYPLSGHPRAMPAAKAAEAARLQGKFWEMHDLLFDHQNRLEDGDLRGYAQTLGLDMERFDQDVVSAAVASRIEADQLEGRGLAVDATPAIFVNGRRFRESPRTIEAYLKEEVEL